MFPPEVCLEIFYFLLYSDLLNLRLTNHFFNEIITKNKELCIYIKDERSFLLSQRIEHISCLSFSYLSTRVISRIESLKHLKKLRIYGETLSSYKIPLSKLRITEIDHLVVDFAPGSKARIFVPDSLHIHKLELSCAILQEDCFLLSNAKIDKVVVKGNNYNIPTNEERVLKCLKLKLERRLTYYQYFFSYIEYFILDFRKSKEIGSSITRIEVKTKNLIVKINCEENDDVLSLLIQKEVENVIILNESMNRYLILHISGRYQNLYLFSFHFKIKEINYSIPCKTFGKFGYYPILHSEKWTHENIESDEFKTKKSNFVKTYMK